MTLTYFRRISSFSQNFWAYVAALLLMASSFTANSQTPKGLNPLKRPSQYILKSWDTEDGLASESTNDLIQTPDGYIWIATYTGLHRFDGQTFTIFTSQNSALPSSNILTMGLDSDSVLWLGTLHGLACYRQGRIEVPASLEAVRGFSTETLHVTSNGIWFSTKSNQLFYYANDTLTDFTENLNLGNSTIQTIAEDKAGNSFFGTADSQLICYSATGGTKRFDFDEATNGINRLICRGDTLFIATGKGLYTLLNQKLVHQPQLKSTAIMSLLIDPTGTQWLGTMRGLFRFNPKTEKLDSITEQSGLPNNIIRDILLDDRHNLWGGTYRSGIFYLSDGSITSYSKNDGLHSDIITGTTELAPGKYLLGNENGQLNLLENGKVSNYEPPIKLPNARLKHIYKDREGRIWISTYAGLYLLDGRNSRSFTTRTGFPDNFIRMVFQDSKGEIWVGTKNAGLIKFKSDGSWEQLTVAEGLTSDYIMAITENDRHELIVNTISGINVLKDNQVIRTLTLDQGLPSNFSFSSLPTEQYLWVASNDGLTGIDGDKIVNFNAENGLPFNIIYDVLTDGQGNLWLPGEKAILKVSISELEAKVKDPSAPLHVALFDKENGMKNNQCLGGVLSFTDSDRGFWIPTLGGIVNLKPSEIRSLDQYGNTIIEEIQADNVAMQHESQTLIPPQTSRLSIKFTGINYEQSEKLKFRYMLRPFDTQWVIGQTERNARYTNLPPGKYEFLLQAGIDNSFLDPISSQTIIIEASWWQTTWAKVMFGLATIGMGIFVYWMRLQNLTSRNIRLSSMVKSRTEELENQKQELTLALEKLSDAQAKVIQSEKMASLGILSAGVAHEINNPLNFIKSGSHLLQKILTDYLDKGQPISPEDTKDVRMLLENIGMGSDRIKKIVSSLSLFSRGNQDEFKSCDLEEVIDSSLTILQHEYRNRIEITKRFEAEKVVVWGNESKLYQVFINLFSNAIHAIAGNGEILIYAYYDGAMTQIEIQDTGIGIPKEILSKVFDPFFTTKAAGVGTGLGLSIIYNIIKEHKGEISITSKSGEGTRVKVSLPTQQVTA